MAWAAIERCILVFHHQWLNTQKKRIFIHYVPLTTIILYPCIFYTACIFFAPCQNTLDYSKVWCYGPCFYGIKALFLIDILANVMLPPLLIIIFNISLFVRVIKHKQRLRQQVQWHKYRRMIIQLVSCSALFLLLNLPLSGLFLAQAFGLPYGATGQFEVSLYFLSYLLILWMPFVCFGSSPDIWLKMKQTIGVQYFTNTVVPQRRQPVQ
jgi:hypothetical protein